MSPSADPGRDVCGEDQSDPMAGVGHGEPLRQDQQPRAHRHPGVHRLLLIRQQGKADFQGGYENTSTEAQLSENRAKFIQLLVTQPGGVVRC